MHLFSVQGKLQPGKAEEFAQKWKDFYGSRAKGMSGFHQAYYAVDPVTDSALAVWVWSKKPDESQLHQAIQEFLPQIRSLIIGSPTSQWYEVLQQI